MMKYNDERIVFNQILSLTPQQLKERFAFREEMGSYFFDEIGHPGYSVSVQKSDDGEGFFVPVNADFNFARPAGSHNYPELRQIGLHLIRAFGLAVDWA